uniref:Uncharacterized protein n=1 Tax=Arundo donax TaxID=35708 RepID=A0A0A9EBM3_ARUDO
MGHPYAFQHLLGCYSLKIYAPTPIFIFYMSHLMICVTFSFFRLLVIDYKLTYPSGTATAVLINGFHTPKGEENAKKQVSGFLRCFAISLLWSFFQWFYTGFSSILA